MSELDRTGYTYWSNERYIAESGQCGVIHSRLFKTPEAAREYYGQYNRITKYDVLVKITAVVAEGPDHA